MLCFQNCQGYFSTGGVFVQSKGCTASPAEMEPAYRSTYLPIFFKYSCTECHAPGGEKSDSAFANPDAFSGLTIFRNIGGPIAVEEKLSAGHQSYNFQTMKAELDEAKNAWFGAGFGECPSGFYTTSEKRANFFEPIADPATGKFKVDPAAINVPQTIVWELDDETFNPAIPGATVSLQIEAVPGPEDFPSHYVVKNILFNSDSTLEIEGVRVLLNGSTYSQNTWAAAKGFVVGDNAPLEGAGSQMTIFKGGDELYSRTDSWSISFSSVTVRSRPSTDPDPLASPEP